MFPTPQAFEERPKGGMESRAAVILLLVQKCLPPLPHTRLSPAAKGPPIFSWSNVSPGKVLPPVEPHHSGILPMQWVTLHFTEPDATKTWPFLHQHYE